MQTFYTLRSNAKRAARAALGKIATEGTDYIIIKNDQLGGQFGFKPIEKAKPAKVPKVDRGGRKKSIGPRKILNIRGDGRHNPKRKAKAPAKAEAGAWAGELIDMLKRPQGATALEVGERFGWLEHTSRARISVTPRTFDPKTPMRSVRTREERGGKMVSVYRIETELPLNLKREQLGVRYDKQPRVRKPKAKAA